VARLTEQKGQRYLLQALATIIRAMPMARCILVGDGEDRAALEQQAAQLGLTQAVTFAGHADEAAVKQHLETATLFALPSLWEGVPLALLEAIASGLPVICTDIPGNRELIHDGISGWLVPARHPQALATAILDAASDPAGAQQRAQAARASLHRFDIDQLAGQHVDLYAELLHKRP
jgi:glycosyltransferase involved in cell wall biosynthesis